MRQRQTGEADTTTQGTHEGRQMKGDKAQTRRRGGHHHSGRHMKGDK